MLVLSRKPGERIHVGENITITVVRIGPNTVRLGIDAPKPVNIARSELLAEDPRAQEKPAEANQSPRVGTAG